METGSVTACASRSSTALSLPVTSSSVSASKSRNCSMATTICAYLAGTVRRNFSTTRASSMSLSPWSTSCWCRVDSRRAKSSTCSPGLTSMFSHSRRSRCNVARRTLSTPIRVAAMASHASFAVALSRSGSPISLGTDATITSKARLSSRYCTGPPSTASQRSRACILNFIVWLHS